MVGHGNEFVRSPRRNYAEREEWKTGKRREKKKNGKKGHFIALALCNVSPGQGRPYSRPREFSSESDGCGLGLGSLRRKTECGGGCASSGCSSTLNARSRCHGGVAGSGDEGWNGRSEGRRGRGRIRNLATLLRTWRKGK